MGSCESSPAVVEEESTETEENPAADLEDVPRADLDIGPIKEANLPIVWVLGGPGSGKGTQCRKLADQFEFAHLSTGHLLRKEAEGDSDRAVKLNQIMENGDLVPLGVVLDLLAEAMLTALPDSKGFLIDGYPRDLEQAKQFEDEISPCTQIFYLKLSDEVMRERLLKRGETSGRADDNEETINRRIENFHEISEPIVEEYGAKCTEIEGEQPMEDINAVLTMYTEKILENHA